MDYVDLFGQYTVPPSDAQYSLVPLVVNSTLSWPTNYTGQSATEFAASTCIDIAAAPSLALRLPAADQVSVGTELRLRNVGANTVDIQNSTGASVTTIAPGVVKYFQVTDNTLPAGVWAVYTFGTGTSGADAVALAGDGLTVLGNKLHIGAPYRGINSGYTVQLEDRAHVLDAVAGGLVLSMLSAATALPGFYVMLRNSSSGTLDVLPSGAELIDGSLAKSIGAQESLILVSTGSNWISVGFGRDATLVFGEVVVNAAVSPVTLSSADVAGRMIRVSGTASADLVVNLPAIDNIYFINIEAGVGAYTVTFTTGGGGTTVLGANQKTVVYCDGINVSPAITTTVTSSLALVDGNAAAPSIAFALDTDTGFFRNANGVIGVASNGVMTMRFNGSGIVFTPVGNITATNVFAALAQLDGFITTNAGAIAALDTRLDTAEGNITTLQGQMTAAQGDITTLQTTRETKWTIVNRAASGSMAVDEKAYVSTDGVTLQLPATMTPGQKVAFVVLANVSGTVIAANGNVIQGLVDDVEIDVYPHTREVELVYINATVGAVFQ